MSLLSHKNRMLFIKRLFSVDDVMILNLSDIGQFGARKKKPVGKAVDNQVASWDNCKQRIIVTGDGIETISKTAKCMQNNKLDTRIRNVLRDLNRTTLTVNCLDIDL